MSHIVLLGDSIFDNGRYVPGEPDVVEQLRSALPGGWSATLLAVDGAVTSGVAGQLTRLPRDATHLVISVGGNDALGASWILGRRVSSVAEAVEVLAQAQEGFAAAYAKMVGAVAALGLPTALCTIYDTPTTAPDQRIIRTALAVFNDVITRAAFGNRLALIDLRLICGEDEDYANPIEPSARGGAKIAAAIAALVTGRAGSQVIAQP
jgi:lysophospholipase L1-like esterase